MRAGVAQQSPLLNLPAEVEGHLLLLLASEGVQGNGLRGLLALRLTCKAAAAFAQAACTPAQLQVAILRGQVQQLYAHEFADMQTQLEAFSNTVTQLHTAFFEASASGEALPPMPSHRDSLSAKRAVGIAAAAVNRVHTRARRATEGMPLDLSAQALLESLDTLTITFSTARQLLARCRYLEDPKQRAKGPAV